MKKRHTLIGVALSVFTLSASALSLGSARGPVVLGAPIDITVQVQPDAGLGLDALCLSANMVDGDVPMAESSIRITPWPEVQGKPSAIRIQSALPAREPVLSLRLQAGCQGAVVRQYTFLTELPPSARVVQSPAQPLSLSLSLTPPSALASAEAVQDVERRITPSIAAPIAAPSAPPPGLADRAAPTHSEPPPRPPAPKSAKPAKPAQPEKTEKAHTPHKAAPLPQAPQAAPAEKAPPASLARLIMEPLGPIEQSPAPAQAPPLLPAPLDTQGQEDGANVAQAQAQGEQWQSQISDLQRQNAEEKAHAQQLRDRLQALEEARDDSTLLYVLLALLALMTAALAWLFQRLQAVQGQHERQWRDSVAQVMARDKQLQEHALVADPKDDWRAEPSTFAFAHGADEVRTVPLGAAAPGLMPQAPLPEPAPAFDKTLPMPIFGTAPAPEPAQAPAAPAAPAAVQTAPAGQRVIHPEELFDILEQAEFFISVGEHDQAIAILQGHIADKGQASPLSYLELLRLFHQLGRVDDFGRLRAQFLEAFNAHVPLFSQFSEQGRTLDYYVDALAHIEAQWTSASTTALIEGYLFCEGGKNIHHERFDLAAFDDLLLLLGIAQTTPAAARGAPAPRQRTTPLAPPMADIPIPALPESVSQVPEEAAQPVLDIDFDAIFGHIDLPAQPSPDGQAPTDGLGPLVIADIPPLPVTPAPAPGQAVGFGMGDEKYELRFELENLEPESPPPAQKS